MEMNDRIKARRKELKLTQDSLAKRVGVNRVTVTGWESGDYKPGGENLQALAAALNCNPGWLLDGGDINEQITYVGKVRPGLVPVVGDAVLGVDGMIDMVEYRGGWLKIYSDDPNAYGLRVRGDSMWPRIQSGEFVLIEPGSTVHPGDEVFVRTSDGHNMIKVLNYTRDGEYQFNSINQDHRPITMARADVIKVQYVAGILKASRHVDNDIVTDLMG
ncbi:helix-turn-helix domain-containing protein [Serratia rubidaea]|uniref:helix-turn-helix domain-containing protein n=1 Tax=Serratia rubidaea TaxID=61652 RepID=UPI0022B85A6B|nr:S24 family peptidase [Serratia rubidaea]WBF44468.1 helix-turn-helix domain-containing protein [Serratia rubidaea]